jgi:hypothetical protein
MKYYKKDQCYYKVIDQRTVVVYDFDLLPTISVTSKIYLDDSIKISSGEFYDAFQKVSNNIKQLFYENI